MDARIDFSQKRNWWNIKKNTMCLTRKKVTFLRKIVKHITWTECGEKLSEYYTCKGCEDEVNRKGHLMKPQEEVYVENVKNDF